jgi:hypothetical protein
LHRQPARAGAELFVTRNVTADPAIPFPPAPPLRRSPNSFEVPRSRSLRPRGVSDRTFGELGAGDPPRTFDQLLAGLDDLLPHQVQAPMAPNLRYVSAARHTGHLYATVARSFKAATRRHLHALHVGWT